MGVTSREGFVHSQTDTLARLHMDIKVLVTHKPGFDERSPHGCY